MNRSDLIIALANRFPQLTAKDAEVAVKELLDALTAAMARGDRVEIRGFGVFALNYRPPRLGRNPKSGEKVPVPAKYVPHFKAGKELRDRVDMAATRDGSASPDGQVARRVLKVVRQPARAA